MSRDVYLTNDKNSNLNDSIECTYNEVSYLNSRLSYLEKIIQSKYSDMLYLASEICNLKNINLKYDLIDILVKHGSNLSKYKAELIDVKDMINSLNANQKKCDNHTESTNNEKTNTNIENLEPHASQLENEQLKSDECEKEKFKPIGLENNVEDGSENIKEKNSVKKALSNNLAVKKPRVIDADNTTKSKTEIAREKIISNLDKLISYKENTFNDLIEMIDFQIDSNAQKNDLIRFIENLESQIVELNEYKNNILKNYSLSKSIELGSNGKMTFSRVFIEKERLIDKNKDEYIKVVTDMFNLYSEFVDKYLKNINMLRPHLESEKINSMQSNCSKVIYDLKLIRNLYSSLDKLKEV